MRSVAGDRDQNCFVQYVYCTPVRAPGLIREETADQLTCRRGVDNDTIINKERCGSADCQRYYFGRGRGGRASAWYLGSAPLVPIPY